MSLPCHLKGCREAPSGDDWGSAGGFGELNERTNGWRISAETCGWQRGNDLFPRVMTHSPTLTSCEVFTPVSLFISNTLFAHQCASRGYLPSTLQADFKSPPPHALCLMLFLFLINSRKKDTVGLQQIADQKRHGVTVGKLSLMYFVFPVLDHPGL